VTRYLDVLKQFDGGARRLAEGFGEAMDVPQSRETQLIDTKNFIDSCGGEEPA
jgi:hypothetical protein